MSIVPVESQRFELMEQVADLKLIGTSDTAIAKKLGLKRAEVIELYNDFKDALSTDALARDMARDHLHNMSRHFDKLILEAYALGENIDSLQFSHQVAAQKNSSIKLIADLESKRLEAYQKAGLLDSAYLGDEIVELEQKQKMLLDILRDDLCPDCKITVATKLSDITKQAEVLEVIDAEIVP